MSCSLEEVAAHEFGATLALGGNHVTARTLGARSHRYPRNCGFRCAGSDL